MEPTAARDVPSEVPKPAIARILAPLLVRQAVLVSEQQNINQRPFDFLRSLLVHAMSDDEALDFFSPRFNLPNLVEPPVHPFLLVCVFNVVKDSVVLAFAHIENLVVTWVLQEIHVVPQVLHLISRETLLGWHSLTAPSDLEPICSLAYSDSFSAVKKYFIKASKYSTRSFQYANQRSG